MQIYCLSFLYASLELVICGVLLAMDGAAT